MKTKNESSRYYPTAFALYVTYFVLGIAASIMGQYKQNFAALWGAETLADGSYTAELTMEGGSGRATIQSPAGITVADGTVTATLEWSSPNYDYMLVDGEKYLPTSTENGSTFEIPVAALETPLEVVADTTAMSTPHEIEYTLTFELN